MDTSYFKLQLDKNKNIYNELFNSITKEQILWRSVPEKWNMLEIVCHLYDEEKEDFRARLQHVIRTPEKPMPAIDPVGWVVNREYASKDFYSMVNHFLEERKQSVDLLKSLSNASWDNVYMHPKLGPLTARLFLTNWLAHDYLHIKQIVKIKYDYLAFVSREKLDYAGVWK